MRTIRVKLVDFVKKESIEDNFLLKTLRKYYEVELVEKGADYVLCGTFGTDYLQEAGIRIYYTGEALCPDFNLYDYAIGFDDIRFGDRYLRYPLCIVDKDTLNAVLHKHQREDGELLSREAFCNYVVSAGSGHRGIRDTILDAVSGYRRVDSGGCYRNNLPDGQPVADKRAFQQKYRFTLAPENAKFPGYVTEKIMDAWAAGTIPIYYGPDDALEWFDPDAYIHIADAGHMEGALQRIREVNEDQEQYLAMQHTPAIPPGSPLQELIGRDVLGEFLCRIIEQPLEAAYRRNSRETMIGRFYEHRVEKWDKVERNRLYRFARDKKRKYFGLKKIQGV